jgi:hypothetical protein
VHGREGLVILKRRSWIDGPPTQARVLWPAQGNRPVRPGCPQLRYYLPLSRVTMKLAACALVFVAPLISAMIEGQVTNGVTGAGISGATVRFMDRTSHAFQTTTDASGAYRLTGLADGEYHGAFSKDGFSDYRQGSSLSDLLSGANSVRISGDVPSAWMLACNRGARYAAGSWMKKASPRLKWWSRLAGMWTIVQQRIRMASSPSRSFIRDHTPWWRSRSPVHTCARASASVRFRSTILPLTQLADALPVQVGWGADIAAIEIHLKSVPVHRVAGVVLDEAGKPVARSTVSLLGRPLASRQAPLGGGISAPGPAVRGNRPFITGFHGSLGPDPEPELATVESRPDGTFEFPAVQQGDWRLTAEFDSDNEKPRFGVASAFVGDKDIEGVQIRLSGPFRVPVTANWGSVQPAPSAMADLPLPRTSCV